MLFTPIGTAGGIYASLAERTPDTTQAADKIEAVLIFLVWQTKFPEQLMNIDLLKGNANKLNISNKNLIL